MKRLLIFPLLGALLIATGTGAAERPAGILMLGIDTLRADHLHCAGMDGLQTPNIDALAADGVYFRRCQSTAPWTLPAFASIYTGMIPWRHGATGGRYQSLGDENVTMAEYLRDAGYATGARVTVNFLMGNFGTGQGFDDMLFVSPKKKNAPPQAVRVTDSGLDFLRKHAADDFFLLLHYFDVHAPYLPPAPFDRMYYDGDERAPGDSIRAMLMDPEYNLVHVEKNRGHLYEWLEGVTDLEYPVRQYAAGVTYTDDHVGQVIAHLKAEGLYDGMMIILVADHGEHLGEHHSWFTHFRPYQECVHVPLIIKYPGGLGAGTVVDEPVSATDVLPTVLEITGLEAADRLDGRSLNALAAGLPDTASSLLLSEHGGDSERLWKTLVEWPWKLMCVLVDGEASCELFDLEADPGELSNIAAAHPDVLRRLQDRLWSVVDRDNPVVTSGKVRAVKLSPEERERLRALGY